MIIVCLPRTFCDLPKINLKWVDFTLTLMSKLFLPTKANKVLLNRNTNRVKIGHAMWATLSIAIINIIDEDTNMYPLSY